jgi:hypothetical protein
MWLSPTLFCSSGVVYLLIMSQVPLGGVLIVSSAASLCGMSKHLDLLLASFSHSLPVSTSMDTFPLSLKDQFLASFNPASASMQWLLAERMDSLLLCRSVHHNRVSVDLKTSCHQSVASMSGFSYPAMMEPVMNSFEYGHCTPLIVDLGASCCIMPHRSDFTHYTCSSIKIKDLSGVNTVAGRGLIK